MPISSRAKLFENIPKTYLDLIRWHQPRPIKNKTSYRAALKIIDALAGRELNQDQSDFLAILALLAIDFERTHLPRPELQEDPIEVLTFLLEQNDMDAADLGCLLGNPKLGATILAGEKRLRKAHKAKLARRFKVPPTLFD